ncbi:MAG: hypothetical protein LC624_03400 [Halobacteriales archaeon]|nr:hypothetical protein [Halobacteriales archaeon]
MRAPLAFLVLALLLAGCASNEAKGTPVSRIEVVAVQDDYDCNGSVDIFMELRALGADQRQPVPFDGSMDAVLSRLVAGSTYTRVDNWSAVLHADQFAPDGTIQWFEPGEKVTPGTYRLAANANVQGQGSFTAATDVTLQAFPFLVKRAC